MKYIRTKNGRIIKSLTEIKEAYDKVPIYIYTVMTDGYKHCCNIQRDFVEKLADTIEELCDEFVAYNSEQNNGLPITCPKEMLGKIKPYIQIGMQKRINCWLCGAIWTDKGLIYVAKMNEKGVMELL